MCYDILKMSSICWQRSNVIHFDKGILFSIIYRYRLQTEDNKFRWRASKTSDMGYGGTRKVPNPDYRVLQGCYGHSPNVRYH